MMLINIARRIVNRLFKRYEIKAMPWLTFSSKRYVDKFLKKRMKVFEWGSGGSTLYFAKKVAMVISVEHDKFWYKKVLDKLSSLKVDNYECNLIAPELGFDSRYLSTDLRFKNHNFKNYCKYINKFPDYYFDLILVDGRARVGCAKNAYEKVKSGGIIILDNSERTAYSPAREFLLKKGFREKKFFGKGPNLDYSWQTSIFLKRK